MKSTFTADFFIGNRARLRELFTGTAPIVLTANGLLQRNTDSHYPFKQDGNFWYLTGVDDPNIILVMDKNKEYLIVPELSDSKVVFDGAIDLAKISMQSGISEILPERDGWKRLSAKLKKANNVAVLSPAVSFIESLGMYTNPARANLIKIMRSHNPDLTLLDLRQHLSRMRMVKQPLELAQLQKAIDITTSGIKKINKKFIMQKYINEFEVEQELSRHFWKRGASGHSFDPIVASGSKGLTLHAAGNNGVIGKNSQLLLDVGAEFEHYAADISRTWHRSPSKRFTAVHEAVCEVADYAMSILKPGIVMADYEKLVQNFMGEKLRELGLIKTIEQDNVRRFFPHATSHFLGIDVHDVGDYKRPLEAGVVLTVEPGIYIPDESIAVRIEDNILITEHGCKNLSGSLAR